MSIPKILSHTLIYHTTILTVCPHSLKVMLCHKKNLVSKTLIGSALRLHTHFLFLISLLYQAVQWLQLLLSPFFSFFCTSRNLKYISNNQLPRTTVFQFTTTFTFMHFLPLLGYIPKTKIYPSAALVCELLRTELLSLLLVWGSPYQRPVPNGFLDAATT